mmetsp:Transcript_22088/g.47648  ORF Transcript_22088/g.47648 Transcript_22088/m.47648 type:complete len:234 (-) Transcript_22088:48-749(-)
MCAIAVPHLISASSVLELSLCLRGWNVQCRGDGSCILERNLGNRLPILQAPCFGSICTPPHAFAHPQAAFEDTGLKLTTRIEQRPTPCPTVLKPTALVALGAARWYRNRVRAQSVTHTPFPFAIICVSVEHHVLPSAIIQTILPLSIVYAPTWPSICATPMGLACAKIALVRNKPRCSCDLPFALMLVVKPLAFIDVTPGEDEATKPTTFATRVRMMRFEPCYECGHGRRDGG